MKKTMRKILPIIACVLVLLIGLVACEINGDKSNVSNEKNLIAVRVEGSPIEVYVGEAFEAKNLTVHLDYDDGTTESVKFTEEDLPEEYIPLLSIVGEHTVEMLYRGFEIAFKIIVKEPPLLVRFFNCLDEIVKEEYVDYGTLATAPTDEQMYVEGYYFTGEFDKDFSNVTENTDVYGIYEQLYTVKFYNAVNEVAKSMSVVSGAAAEAPTNEQMYVEGYYFTGEFDKDFSNVTENMDVYGIYERLFKVEFFNGKSELISSQYVKLGEDATEPTEEQRAMEGYVWKSWDNSFTNIQKDTKVYGIYAKAYTIIYSSEDENKGTVSGNVASGSAIILGTNITLTAEAKEGYTFNGWYMNDELVSDEAEYSFTTLTKNYTFVAKFDENETTKYSEGLEFTSNGDGTCYVSGIGTCTDTDIRIPPISPKKEQVTGIGWEAFEDCDSIIGVEIPNGVIYIDNFAFYYCMNLTYIIIPDSVNSIGGNAFAYCYSLGSITIPDSVTKIGSGAFLECRTLETVNFSKDSNLESIERETFGFCCSLDRITIPDSVKNIGFNAFDGCESLVSVTIGNGVTNIGSAAFLRCLKIVEVINKSSQLSITKGASDNGLVAVNALEVHTGESKIVNKDGFLFYTYEDVNYLVGYEHIDYKRKLTNLVLPDNYIGEPYEIYKEAFYGCDAIISITLPNNITNIGAGAFDYCGRLVEIINNSNFDITTIDYPPYLILDVHTGESKIVNKDDFLFHTYGGVNYLVGYIGNQTQLVLPENYNGEPYVIGEFAFYQCYSIVSVRIPDSVTKIDYVAFDGCESLQMVRMGEGVTGIGSGAFEFCNHLESITIGNRVENIGVDAFASCKRLTYVVIPNSVTYINPYIFSNCHLLTDVYYIGNEEEWLTINIQANNDHLINATRYYYSETEPTTEGNFWHYVNGVPTPWPPYEAKYSEGLEFTSNGDGTCYVSGIGTCTDTDIKIPPISPTGDEVISIGSNAFANCSSLVSIEIPDSVTSIGSYAFQECSNLASVTIPESVTAIGEWAFAYCSNINSVYIMDLSKWCKIEFGGDFANPIEVGWPDADLYLNGSIVEHLQIPEDVDKISPFAFRGCGSIKSIEIGANVEEIDGLAFMDCLNLESIIIQANIKAIDFGVFYNCPSITDIYYMGTEEEWSEISIADRNDILTTATIHYNYAPEE